MRHGRATTMHLTRRCVFPTSGAAHTAVSAWIRNYEDVALSPYPYTHKRKSAPWYMWKKVCSAPSTARVPCHYVLDMSVEPGKDGSIHCARSARFACRKTFCLVCRRQ